MRTKLAIPALTLFALLAGTADGRAAETDAPPTIAAAASTRRVAMSVGAATLVGVGLPDFTAAGGLTLGLREDWSVFSRFRLGFVQAVTMTSLPYGNGDGEPAPLRRIENNAMAFSSATSFPTRLLGTAAVDLDRVRFDAGVGAVFLASSPMGAFSFFPGFVAQAGVAVPLGAPGARSSLRLDVWRAYGWGMDANQSVIVPELSLDVRI
jgi:hypothetical protein